MACDPQKERVRSKRNNVGRQETQSFQSTCTWTHINIRKSQFAFDRDTPPATVHQF